MAIISFDFLLTAKRDKRAALRFFSNTAAIRQYNKNASKRIELRQYEYLNNIVE